ncbi:TetR/AcrR family transcriptional regulator [Streptomyces sp. NPDC054933]
MAGEGKRRTQQERRAEAEQRVLEAATTLIAQNGSRSVSLAEVGRVAGYSRGIVNHHFGSREQLLAAVVRHAQQFDVPTADGGGLARITALVSSYLANLRDRAPASQAFLLLWAESMASDPVLAPLFAERDTWFRNLLADHIRAGIEDGTIRSDVDPQSVAVSLVGTLRGIGIQFLPAVDDPLLDKVAEHTVQMIRRALAPTDEPCVTQTHG